MGLAGVSLLVAWTSRGLAAPDAGQDLTPTARELSDQALRQYQAGELDPAIESFMGAYALSNNPGLLFNVAQAYRLKGDCQRARDYYQRYLDDVPATPLKPSLERRVAEMTTCLENRRATAAVKASEPPRHLEAGLAATKPAPPVLTTPNGAPTAAVISPTRRAATWALRGSAAGLLASAAAFGALAWSAHQDFESANTQRAAWDANDRYTTASALGWSFAAAGLACAVASYFVGRHR